MNEDNHKTSSNFNYENVLDVAIIGGGFAGVNAALYLTRYKLNIALIEQGNLGSGASNFNAGFVSNFPLKATNSLISKPVNYMKNFHNESIQYLKNVIEYNNIDCEFTNSGLLLLSNKFNQNSKYALLKDLKNESEVNGFKYGYLKEDSYTINPFKYIKGLKIALIANNANILEQTQVTHIIKNKDFYEIRVKGSSYIIKSKKVIIANGSGELINNQYNNYLKCLYPITSGIIVTKILTDDLVSRISNFKRAFITEGTFINYFRVTEDNRFLFGGKQTLTQDPDFSNYQYLKQKLTDYFPFLKNIKIDFHWQKTLMFNATGVPIVKKIDDNLFFVNGFCGSGIANASYCGSIIGNAIIADEFSHPIFLINHPKIPNILKSNFMRKFIPFFL